MRIIAGKWRGRNVAAPKGELTRPTADRMRETLFNMLNSRLGTFEGLTVADMFAGSGALGLEALSRGASHCLFVEQDENALATIRTNVSSLGARLSCDVRAGSVLTLGPAKVPHDLILLDPPYETGAGPVALERLLRLGWIGPATWIALETGAREDVLLKSFTIEAERKVGKGKLRLLRLRSAAHVAGDADA
ncbi:16S rRNA (guanine(966)-N(2))-methyltransferase RsmD [Altererythrobacter sp. SALINAS58]|uniref:16S rRNA (guanine(966)-N(2))-methyltransferase RsmD n=1 Tax=Alteripontixanthobacter muriae TaxID=2705546 RepID=UPI0015760350|nr:16S rRNA (guanine(966)-N(2))-methyltransferase RsmD [Alteripontixanthobacter muriae]NTZ42991.1 16S rRNA (guanine(966)-N(2))-methyltransferase RsmD [Alteripontixanthobacter muriae]